MLPPLEGRPELTFPSPDSVPWTSFSREKYCSTSFEELQAVAVGCVVCRRAKWEMKIQSWIAWSKWYTTQLCHGGGRSGHAQGQSCMFLRHLPKKSEVSGTYILLKWRKKIFKLSLSHTKLNLWIKQTNNQFILWHQELQTFVHVILKTFQYFGDSEMASGFSWNEKIKHSI